MLCVPCPTTASQAAGVLGKALQRQIDAWDAQPRTVVMVDSVINETTVDASALQALDLPASTQGLLSLLQVRASVVTVGRAIQCSRPDRGSHTASTTSLLCSTAPHSSFMVCGTTGPDDTWRVGGRAGVQPTGTGKRQVMPNGTSKATLAP